MAHVLDFHRREDKANWWEYFRLEALSTEDLVDERAGISGLTFAGAAGGTAKAPIHRYHFPPQETEIRGGESLRSVGGTKLGTVDSVSMDDRTVDIKKRMDCAASHPDAVFAHDHVSKTPLAESLLRIGQCVAENGIEGPGPYLAARDLLLRSEPRTGGAVLRLPDETPLEAGVRIAPRLVGGVLPIQGPPGSGKTYIGARMICALVRTGAKVGITANSHKVIRNLLDEVVRAADEQGVDLCCIQKPDEMEDDKPHLRFAKRNGDVFTALASDRSFA